MAATTTLLGLVTPTQGSLPGVWGDTVNYGITEYLDIAIAGTLTLTGDGTVILANTTGSSSGTNITSTLSGAGTVTAQFAIVKVSGTTGVKIVQAPSFSRTYLVVNASSFAVTFKPSAASGVSIAAGETASVYYNGADYVKVVGTATAGAAGGSTTQVQYNNAGVLAGITGATTNGTALTLVAPNLGTPASGTVTNLTGTASININGTVGATTASTGAFTTLSATGSGTLTNLLFSGGTLPGVGTPSIALRSSDNIIYHQAGSANSIILLDSVQNAMYIATATSHSFNISNVNKLTLNSTGLQVTNTLSGGTSGTGYSFDGSAPAGSLSLISSGRFGIGMSLPTSKLTIGSDSFTAAASNTTGMYTGANGLIILSDGLFVATRAGVDRVVLDTSGNLGLGVTPSAWSSIYKAFQIGAQGAFWANATANDIYMSANYLYDGANKYIANGYASFYSQNSGEHIWKTAPNNTSGAGAAATFTQVLAVDKDKSLALQGATAQTGTGITFPATQSASTDANTLDDYEEGSYAPTQGSGLTVVGTFSSSGRYTKIGNLVTVNFTVGGSTSIACTSAGQITGNLPFSIAASPGNAMGSCMNSSNVNTGAYAFLTEIYSGTTALAASGAIFVTITYQV